ncbi:MAG: NAD(P)-dependent oxidoreductase [Burkholderiales bacterium]
MTTNSTLGVIGIGAMGMAAAKHAIDAGLDVCVRDVRSDAEAEARVAGARVCSSPAEIARHADVIVILVVDAGQVEEVIFGTDGLLTSLTDASVVVVSSTIAPSCAESVARRLAAAGKRCLDAPVSGGPARARDGSMSMMVAGSDEAFDAARPVLGRLASRLFRIGTRPGDGSRTKMLNNLLAGVNLAAAAEAVALGEKLGLDPLRLLDVIRASSGDSWMLGDRMPRALAGDYSPRAAIPILGKDLGIVTGAAREAGYPTPLGDAALSVFKGSIALGLSDLDDAAVLEFYRRSAPAGPGEAS